MSDLNNKKNNSIIRSIKASFSGRKFKSGAYVTIISAIVIVIILVANMLVSQMNISFDFSSQRMYTLTKETKELVQGIEDEISIYYIVQPGNETPVFDKIVEKYEALSDKITVEYKDPILYPQFAAQYVEEEVTENSFLIVNHTKERAKYVDGYDLLVQELNYNTYQYETTGIDVEGKITSAILYVTTEKLPVVYVVEGHGELETGASFNDTLDKMNVSVETLASRTIEAIPEDCEILFINAPQSDLNDTETAMIKEYLAGGGNAIITLDYVADTLANFKSILEYYGVATSKGMIFEGDTNYFEANYPLYLLPELKSHDITKQARESRIPVLVMGGSGLKISDTLRSTLTVEPLLITSDLAYSKVGEQFTTTTKEPGDVSGPFHVGLLARDTYNDVSSNVILFSSKYMFIDDVAGYANMKLLSGSIGYLTGDMELLSIPTKSLGASMLYPSQQEAILWGAVTVLIIPIFILATGIAVSLARRKR